MRRRFMFFALLLAPASVMAQAPVCSEQKIQAAVQKPSLKYSDDSFFWSGAFDKPLIGKAQQQAEVAKARKDEPRKNELSGDHPQRIVIAKSGDMAYEYGTGKLSYDEAKTGKHIAFQTAYVRVWKSANGECQVAAFLVMPIESTMVQK